MRVLGESWWVTLMVLFLLELFLKVIWMRRSVIYLEICVCSFKRVEAIRSKAVPVLIETSSFLEVWLMMSSPINYRLPSLSCLYTLIIPLGRVIPAPLSVVFLNLMILLTLAA